MTKPAFVAALVLFSFMARAQPTHATEIDCPCLLNGGQPGASDCLCDVFQCYDDCVRELCPDFPQCAIECSSRCSCYGGPPQCATHRDPGPTPTATCIPADSTSCSAGQIVTCAEAQCSSGCSCRCIGDCDGSLRVTVDELLLGIGIALEQQDPEGCEAFTAGKPQIDELITAVGNILSGCPLIPTQTATPTPTSVVDPIGDTLAETVFRLCGQDLPWVDVRTTEPGEAYGFRCETRGHETSGTLTRFASPAEAAAAVDEALLGITYDSAIPYDFHGLPAMEWENDIDLFSYNQAPEYHGVIWATGCWLVNVRAFDDTHFWLLGPKRFSEEWFRVAVETGVLDECAGHR